MLHFPIHQRAAQSWRRRLFLAFILMLAAQGMLAGRCIADDFADQFASIESQSLVDVGRDEVVQAYVQLIDKHPQHPGRAQAMMNIAKLWGMNLTKANIFPDREKQREWLLRVRAETAPGDELWCDASLQIAVSSRRLDPEGAKKLLREIIDRTRNPIVEVEAYYQLQCIARTANDFAEAERICILLQNWMVDENKQPETMLEKGKFFEVIQGSATSMMIAWSEMHAPTHDRKAKIDALYESYHGRRYMEQAHQRAINHLHRLPVMTDETFRNSSAPQGAALK